MLEWPPMRAGPIMPPTEPTELMRATPVAAAGPCRKVAGQEAITASGACMSTEECVTTLHTPPGLLSMLSVQEPHEGRRDGTGNLRSAAKYGTTDVHHHIRHSPHQGQAIYSCSSPCDPQSTAGPTNASRVLEGLCVLQRCRHGREAHPDNREKKQSSEGSDRGPVDEQSQRSKCASGDDQRQRDVVVPLAWRRSSQPCRFTQLSEPLAPTIRCGKCMGPVAECRDGGFAGMECLR